MNEWVIIVRIQGRLGKGQVFRLVCTYGRVSCLPPTSLAIYVLNVFASYKYMCMASYNHTTKNQFCCVAFSIVLQVFGGLKNQGHGGNGKY